jgi:phage shock protein C
VNPNRTPFRIDRENGKLLGVCAGIADHFGIDIGLVRAGMAISAVLTFPVVAFGYFIVALIADQKVRPPKPAVSQRAGEARDRMRDLDVRLQAIESELTHSGTRLAREIDSLR